MKVPGAAMWFFVGTLICAEGSVVAQSPTPAMYGAGGQVSPSVQVPGAFAGSVPVQSASGTVHLSLKGAIELALQRNLGLLLSRSEIESARGQRWTELSALLPHITSNSEVVNSKTNAGEIGLTSIPGINVSPAIGPFSYLDARAAATQSIFDWKAINKTRAAAENVKSARYRLKDAQDLVVLAVAAVYLQAIADEARTATDQAQVEAAKALYQQAQHQVDAGTAADIDALRSKVQLQTRVQQLIQAKNDFAIQKLTVSRVIGLAPGQEFDLSDKTPEVPFEPLSVPDALKRAYASRSDYLAAQTEVHRAELSLKAAQAGNFPTLSFGANFGTAGTHPSTATEVHDVRGTLSIPIFTGGSVQGDTQQARAALQQSRDRLENLRAQVETDVRTALLNVQTASDEVEVARSNMALADESLAQSRDRFTAGVTDTVEVVQSQEVVARAHEQYISSLYDFNFAKFSLMRAVGVSAERVEEFFRSK